MMICRCRAVLLPTSPNCAPRLQATEVELAEAERRIQEQTQATEAELAEAKRRTQEAAAITGPQPDPGPQFAMPSVSARGRQVDFNILRLTFR